MDALKWIVALALIAVAGFFVKQNLDQRALIDEQNRAVDLVNAQDYAGAADVYLPLLNKVDATARQNISHQLALCYKNQAKLELPVAQQKEFLRKAVEFDASVLTESDKKLLERDP